MLIVRQSKLKQQIKDEMAVWIVTDHLKMGVEEKIPLGLFGFLH